MIPPCWGGLHNWIHCAFVLGKLWVLLLEETSRGEMLEKELLLSL